MENTQNLNEARLANAWADLQAHADLGNMLETDAYRLAFADPEFLLRRETRGDTVTYVVNRNINYTNICSYACTFCAFSKSSSKAGFRDKPYMIDAGEVAQRAREAVARGATEVCLQGGIHPSYTGETYSGIVRAVKQACPDLHIHAFSPMEVMYGARRTGMTNQEIDAELNKKSGILGITGKFSDRRDMNKAADEGDHGHDAGQHRHHRDRRYDGAR